MGMLLRRIRHLRSKSSLWMLTLLLLCVLLVSFSHHGNKVIHVVRFAEMRNGVRSAVNKAQNAIVSKILQAVQGTVGKNSTVCRRPKLDLYNEAIKDLFYSPPPLKCEGEELMKVTEVTHEGSKQLKVDDSLLAAQELDRCVYLAVDRLSDNYYSYSEPLEITNKPFEVNIKHDFFRILCFLKSDKKEETGTEKYHNRQLKYVQSERNYEDGSGFVAQKSAYQKDAISLNNSNGNGSFVSDSSSHFSKMKFRRDSETIHSINNKFISNNEKLENAPTESNERFAESQEHHKGEQEFFPASMSLQHGPDALSVPHPGESLSEKNEYAVTDRSIGFDYSGFPDYDESLADFDQFVVQVYPKSEVIEEAKKTRYDQNVVNVLVFVIESMSAMSFKRKMPKTGNMLWDLGAVNMNGYNIIGDGTTPQITAMLTGKTVEELPEVRRTFPDAGFVDEYPLLFFDFESRGFVTMFAEDEPTLATFNLRLNGFEEPPADHYMRPFWQAIWDSELNKRSKRFCLGSKAKHLYTLEYAFDFFHKYPTVPKFAFVFHSELSHSDVNPVEYLDEDLASFFQDMRLAQHLENTVVLLLGDHGVRYSKARVRVQGKMEERLPLAYIIPPRRWREYQHDLIHMLRENSDRLSSPFDVYETVKDLLNVTRALSNVKKPVEPSRGISWLRRIPYDRSCADAGIETHWCTCLELYNLDKDTELVRRAAEAIVECINNRTEAHRNKCVGLSLKHVIEAQLVIPNEQVLKYFNSFDDDHRIANFTRKINIDMLEFQVSIRTKPNEALYEATVKYYTKRNRFEVTAEISRPDEYGDQPKCIAKHFPHLRKFCTCSEFLREQAKKTVL